MLQGWSGALSFSPLGVGNSVLMGGGLEFGDNNSR
jgi:hypothetical protein